MDCRPAPVAQARNPGEVARDDHAHRQYATADSQEAGSKTRHDDHGQEEYQADVHARDDHDRATDDHDRTNHDDRCGSDHDDRFGSDHDDNDEAVAHDNDHGLQARDDDDAEAQEEAAGQVSRR